MVCLENLLLYFALQTLLLAMTLVLLIKVHYSVSLIVREYKQLAAKFDVSIPSPTYEAFAVVDVADVLHI